MLRCPIDGKPLEIASETLIEQVNTEIANGLARDRQDQRVSQPIESGLIGGQGKWLYPIRKSIPTLIAGEAIAV
ncbi:MAG: Trm112 family protein [Rubripirellula sp.]